MVDLKKVLASKPKPHAQRKLTQLSTPWGEGLDQACVLPEHPNPQFARNTFRVLNGRWECAFTSANAAESPKIAAKTAKEPEDFPLDILVPFSPESALSGVGRQLKPDEILWYRREIGPVGLGTGERCLLHFEAVDFACACYCNGKPVGTHTGGYTPFCFDITDALLPDSNVITLAVSDPSDSGTQLRGKQSLLGGDIWYTSQSGIWQTVWLEMVPTDYVESIKLWCDVESGTLMCQARTTGDGEVTLQLFDSAHNPLALCSTAAHDGIAELSIQLKGPHLWRPEDPYLSPIEMRFGDDAVTSYTALRSVEVKPDSKGIPRIHLNGEPFFVKGVLDQGYWPESLMTAPSDDALVFDIEQTRAMGFNAIRKHIKFESARWYYHCDRLGMLVWQDMVSGGGTYKAWHISYKPTLFKVSWNHYTDSSPSHQASLSGADSAYQEEWRQTSLEMVKMLGNHPCVITWGLFNEGWGQFDARAAYEAVRKADASRPVDAVSGWYDQCCGSYLSEHNYFRPMEATRDKDGRAHVISEFGGLAFAVQGHICPEDIYGYGDEAMSLDEWHVSVKELLAEMDTLEQEGLAGYVYTQLTDIEDETNGLITYDRKVNKLLS